MMITSARLEEMVRNSVARARANGYGPSFDAMTDEELASDLLSFDADFEAAVLEEVAAAVGRVRR